jgi:hypothetical protein
MFRGAKKLLSFFLALAVLLAPLEFAVAHEMGQMTSESIMLMQHDHQSMSQVDDEGSAHNCDGQGICKHCVYCSPALSISFDITLDSPAAMLPQPIFISHYSIDLPVDFRPPRQL